MSSKSLCDKAPRGLRPEMSGKEECMCVFYAISDPSSRHASLHLLSLRFPHSSVSGVATLSEGMVSWASR